MVGGLASDLEKPERYPSGWESLDRGMDHATGVAKMDLALHGLFDRSSLESPFILESDAAEERHNTTQVKASNSYYVDVGTVGYCNGQHALSVEGMEGICYEPLPAEDEPLSDVNIMIRSPLSCKRTRHLSSDTTTSAEVPDVTLEPELEDPL